MNTLTPYRISVSGSLSEEDLLKGIYLVILHANRIPPHIGMIAGKKYHSLTVKGQEINYSIETLLKNIRIRKIPSLFIKLKKHPVLSLDFLSESFILNIQQFNKVESGEATCLSPVKLFFEENFDLSSDQSNFIFELLPILEKRKLIESTYSLFIEHEEFELPVYSMEELEREISIADAEGKKILKINLNQQHKTHLQE